MLDYRVETFIVAYRLAVAGELQAGEPADITPPDVAIEHDFTLIWQRGSRYEPRYRALLREWLAEGR